MTIKSICASNPFQFVYRSITHHLKVHSTHSKVMLIAGSILQGIILGAVKWHYPAFWIPLSPIATGISIAAISWITFATLAGRHHGNYPKFENDFFSYLKA